MKTFKSKILLFFMDILLLTNASLALANDNLAQIAHDNIPPWVYNEARDVWEDVNAMLQQNSEPLISEDRIVTWRLKKADLDKTGNEDYLIIVYGDYCDAITVVIFKKQVDTYVKTWELPQDQWLGGRINAQIDIDDLEGDGKPEIIINRSDGNRNSISNIIKWQGSNSYLIPLDLFDAAFVDLDRDGIKEILKYNLSMEGNVLPDGSIEKIYSGSYDVYKFDGTNYVFSKSIPNEEGHSAFLTASTTIEPVQWYLSWANHSQNNRIKATLSDIEESHPVSEINPASVRLEDRVLPTRTYIENGKFIAEFDKQEVMIYLLKAPRLKPLAVGDKINITLSALLPSGQYVSGSSEIEIVEEPKTIPFSQFDIKHWRINWDQGKHDKNKFHLAGKIDLPDDHTLDLLQKKGTVTITIEKENSMPLSQNVTLDFKQKGPIWRYKASKAQTGTQQQPLDIKKMLIFLQPEVAQDKPGKGHRKRTGWFMIQGDINLSAADQAALLPKASLTLNIPIENITTASSLESTATVDFTVQKDHWFYKIPPSGLDYKENWWDDIKDEE